MSSRFSTHLPIPLILLTAVLAAGCGKQPPARDAGNSTPAAAATDQAAPASNAAAAQPAASDGSDIYQAAMITCPVSGHTIMKSKAIVETYKGREVYLCCPDCVAPFEKDPEKYIAALDAGLTPKPADNGGEATDDGGH